MASTTLKHPFKNGCGEIPKDKMNLINEIKTWLKTQSDLPKLSDEFLYMFLHSNYDNLEKSKKTIQMYFTVRCSAPDIFLNQSPSGHEIQSGLNLVYMVPLPKTTPEGYKVVIFKLADVDPNKFVHLNTAKAMILFNDVRFSEDGIVPGYIVVCDTRGYSWSHLTKLNLHVLRVYTKYMQEAKPVRLKGLHVLYSAKIIDKLMSVAKPFIKSELQKLITIHTGDDLSEFFKSVPQELMPEDYGGKEKSLEALHEENKILMEKNYPEWVEDQENMIKNAMELRKPKTGNDLTVGEPIVAFRSLSID